ncbi:MAG TPA: hypothetical protein VG435_02615 [Acidimicrobiales bacterium]|jgi:DNA-directed RNA polymerase specialized sigma24 family protein|nr:hypothetical protein [Acidimicrobiales bacterium]
MGEVDVEVDAARLSDLVTGATAGDGRAWDGLVEALAPTVWAEASAGGLDPAGAVEVSRATWLRLVDHLDQTQQADQLSRWLTATARRETQRLERLQGIS